MTQRYVWAFPYTIAKLLEAVRDKLTYHESRQKWWSDKRDTTLATLKEKGVVIDESIVERESKLGYSNVGVARRASMSVNLDEALVEDINECTTKIAEHKAKVKEYAGWLSVFSDQPKERQLDLNNDDWLHFFGK